MHCVGPVPAHLYFDKRQSSSVEAMDSDDDIAIIKVTPAKNLKKGASWVTSSFEDFAPALIAAKPKSTAKQLSSSNFDKCPNKATTVQPMISFKSVLSQRQSSTSEQSHSESQPLFKKRVRDTFPAHRVPSVVKTEMQRQKMKTALNSELWSEKYQPKRRDELAVHKKKVEDICNWLKDRSSKWIKHAAPILLLTGPAGVGKSAVMRTLCNELKVEIQEWVNPVASSGDSDFRPMEQEDFRERSSVDIFSSGSQSSQFSNFLLRANKYQALQLGGEASAVSQSATRIILAEEIPNAFYRDPSEFHNILRKYRHCGHCPLVFIISDTSSGSSNIQKLFPPHIQDDIRLESISVNPVAPTMMVKVLNKIASQEAAQGRFPAPSPRVVESIAMSSAGDVRSAINALQFACRQDTIDLRQLRSVQKRLKKESSGSGKRLKYSATARQDSGTAGLTESEVVIGAKDTTCFLFHALGKILYVKRGDPAENGEHPRLPAHLQQQERDPLLLTPEEVVEKTHLSGDYFNTFLHQNYVDFLQSVDDIDRAADYLSQADVLSAQYSSRGELMDYSVSVATRGFIHSDSSISHHTDIRKGHGWRPLHKSQWFSVQNQSQQSRNAAMKLFRGYHWDPEILLTEIVPFINLTNPTLHDPGQISFVQDICQFTRRGFSSRCGPERLDEKDVMDDSVEECQTPADANPSLIGTEKSTVTTNNASMETESDDTLPSSQQSVQAAPVAAIDDDDDECVIEDFDD